MLHWFTLLHDVFKHFNLYYKKIAIPTLLVSLMGNNSETTHPTRMDWYFDIEGVVVMFNSKLEESINI